MMPSWIFPIVAALTLGMPVSAHAATIQISMENLVISPTEAAAKVGDTIEWITKDIFAYKAPGTDHLLLEDIKDEAKSKGTGKWTSQAATLQCARRHRWCR